MSTACACAVSDLSPVSAGEVLRFLHWGPDGAVTFHRREPYTGAWTELGAIRLADLDEKYPSMESHLGRDAYFSIHSVYEQRQTRNTDFGFPLRHRQEKTLRWLNALYIDLDVGRPETPAVEEALDIFELERAELGLPIPSLICFSGQGLWPLWRLCDLRNPTLPPGAFPEKLELYKRILDRLGQLFRHLHACKQSKDAARVMRVPGSLNSKSGLRAAFFRHSDRFTTLAEMAAIVGLRARPTSFSTGPAKDLARQSAARLAWRNRLEGLHHLWRLRGHFSKLTRTRHHALYYLCFFLVMNRVRRAEIERQALRLAASCMPALTAHDVRRAIKSAYQTARQGKFKLSYRTLAAKLKITDAEKAELTEWFHEKPVRNNQRVQLITQRREVVRRELQQGKSLDEVLAILREQGFGMSKRTIKRDAVTFGTFPLVIKSVSLFSLTAYSHHCVQDVTVRRGMVQQLSQEGLSVRKIAKVLSERHGIQISYVTVLRDLRAASPSKPPRPQPRVTTLSKPPEVGWSFHADMKIVPWEQIVGSIPAAMGRGA